MAILRGVSGKTLDCGCLVGVYETYSGDVVRVIDAVGPACGRHRKGDELPAASKEPAGKGKQEDVKT